jgi:hypothetical protein
MDITLLFDYSKKRTSGGSPGVVYDTIESMKQNHRRMEKEDIRSEEHTSELQSLS